MKDYTNTVDTVCFTDWQQFIPIQKLLFRIKYCLCDYLITILIYHIMKTLFIIETQIQYQQTHTSIITLII